MRSLWIELQTLALELTILPGQINSIANKFRQAMLDGLAAKHSPLKMLPSYLSVPSRNEIGTFLVLDFGGTNVRVLLAQLSGQGKFSIVGRVASRLKDADGHYNYISDQSTADQLFDFIALKISTLIKPDTTYSLGHTFSFPTHQTSLNSGTLIHWTKEIKTTGMNGNDITELLTAALSRRGLTDVLPQVIINDTVGALLTGAYIDASTTIGSICGTGHNTAYIEEYSPLTKSPMIINLESGNFDGLPFTSYDALLDGSSQNPGAQPLEKMVSGHYIGELVRIIACHLFDAGLLSSSPGRNVFTTPYLLNGTHLSLLQEDNTEELVLIDHWLEDSLHITNSSIEDRKALKTIAALICTRSAHLVAATYLGIIKHIDPDLVRSHNIAIDGSLYEKMPGYAQDIQMTLDQALHHTAARVTTTLTKDGSGIGAAIATAIAIEMKS